MGLRMAAGGQKAAGAPLLTLAGLCLMHLPITQLYSLSLFESQSIPGTLY